MRRACVALIGLAGFLLVVAAEAHPEVPTSLKLLVAVVLAMTLVRPSAGLIAVAGLLPLAAPIQLLTTGTDVAEMLLAPFLAGAAARLAWRDPATASRIFWPAITFSGLALWSAIDQMATPGTYRMADVWRHLTRTYFIDLGPYGVLHDAVAWIETLGAAIFAEHLLRREPSAGPRAVRLLVISAGALAVPSTTRLIEIALRSPDSFHASLEVMRTLRFNPFYGDLNAAGSLYVLLLVPAVWLAVVGRHWWAMLVVPVLALATWLAGSRTALAAAPAGLALAWLMSAPSRRWVWAGAASFAAALAIMPLMNSPRNVDASVALSFRRAVTEAGLEMTWRRPWFGFGLSRFKAVSPRYTDPDAIAAFGQLRTGENAHNNFLQISAELGLVGLVAFLSIIGVAGWTAWRAVRKGPSLELCALTGGLVAFLATCVMGHPLLIMPVRLVFGLTLGLAAGSAVSSSESIR